jgi:hypothetical protein
LILVTALQGVTTRVFVLVPAEPKFTSGDAELDIEPSPKVHSIVGLPVTVMIGENEDPVVIKVIFSAGSALAIFISIISAKKAIPENFKILYSLRAPLRKIPFIFNLSSGYYLIDRATIQSGSKTEITIFSKINIVIL